MIYKYCCRGNVNSWVTLHPMSFGFVIFLNHHFYIHAIHHLELIYAEHIWVFLFFFFFGIYLFVFRFSLEIYMFVKLQICRVLRWVLFFVLFCLNFSPLNWHQLWLLSNCVDWFLREEHVAYIRVKRNIAQRESLFVHPGHVVYKLVHVQACWTSKLLYVWLETRCNISIHIQLMCLVDGCYPVYIQNL